MPQAPGKHIVLGMSGHIDHGKTSIVKALTGTDTDRLKEEKERGMTTDLGFAFMGSDVVIIDVPGHEKFVKTMVAGVNTVDVALLVVAADDGVMPQTREHLEILRLLQIPIGLIALNKIDLVEPEWKEAVKSDIARLVKGTFLEKAPVIPLSTVTGEGVENLRQAIGERVRLAGKRKDKGVFRLPIDRVFSIKGFGTVVAGTVLSGTIKVDDTVELLPQGRTLRVRGLQVQDEPVTESSIGLRTAINLQGIEKESIERGDVLGQPGFYKPTSMMDATLTYLSSEKEKLENRVRVRFHVGTSEVIARIILLDREALLPGDEGFVQVHFEKPVVADVGDRFVVRSYSPVRTIGGGAILDVHPAKHKRFQDDVRTRLETIGHGGSKELILEHLVKEERALLSASELAKSAGIPQDQCVEILSGLGQSKHVLRLAPDGWFAAANMEALKTRLADLMARLHAENPLKSGIPSGELHSPLKPPVYRKLFDVVCGLLEKNGSLRLQADRIALASHSVQLTDEQKKIKKKIEDPLVKALLMPPSLREVTSGLGKEAEKLVTLMLETGDLVRLEQDIVVHRKAIELAKSTIRAFLLKKSQAGLGEIREHLGITRKYALPLLLYLDSIGLTERIGDYRRLKKTT